MINLLNPFNNAILNNSPSSTVLSFLDKWWGILVPVVLTLVFRQELMEIYRYVRFRWDKRPYTNKGNVVRFEVDGPKWKIHHIDKKEIILLKLDEQGHVTKDAMKQEISHFIRSTLYYDEDL